MINWIARKQWFLDRVGVFVFRANEWMCKCTHCRNVQENGFVIEGRESAMTLYNIEFESQRIIYFDNINDVKNENS